MINRARTIGKLFKFYIPALMGVDVLIIIYCAYATQIFKTHMYIYYEIDSQLQEMNRKIHFTPSEGLADKVDGMLKHVPQLGWHRSETPHDR